MSNLSKKILEKKLRQTRRNMSQYNGNCPYHISTISTVLHFPFRLQDVHHHLHGAYRVLVHHVFGGYLTDPGFASDQQMGRGPDRPQQSELGW